jgi:hypothetical protein
MNIPTFMVKIPFPPDFLTDPKKVDIMNAGVMDKIQAKK